MLKRLQKSLDEKDEGFTLIELLVVIVIIGILAAIAIPLFLSQRDKAEDASVKSDLKNAATNMETAYVDSQKYPVDTAALNATDFEATDGNLITVVGTPGADFCLKGVGESGDAFYYDSAEGGLLPAGSPTC